MTWESSGAGRATLSGALTFATAAPAHALGLQALDLDEANSLQVDCSRLEQVDSAGLAVMLDWMAASAARGRRLRYEYLPESVRRLASISEVETFLVS